MVDVQGEVQPGFEAVREAFAVNFDDDEDVGAAFCLHVDGTKVVDVWAGVADQDTGRAWEEDTLQLVFSTTKGAVAICAAMLAERGELDVDAPVAEYWPEFAAEGKGDVPVRWLLCHKTGLITTDADLSLDEVLAVEPVVEALAAQKPYWEPGTAHGYHALTYGWLLGEVIRRVSGRTVGTFFAEEVAGPLGLDFWIGLPEEEEPRVAPLIPLELPDDPAVREMARAILGPETMLGRALTLDGALGALDFDEDADDEPNVFNTREVRASEIPAANGVATARALSRMYAATIGEVDGVRLLAPETLEQARTAQTDGVDQVLMFESVFGLGFMLRSPMTPMLDEGSFGHAGAGGSQGYADPESGVAFGYVMNKMTAQITGDPRTARLTRAVEESLR